MITRITALLAIVITTTLATADLPPPMTDLATLSDRSVDEVFADWKIVTGQQHFLVIVGEQTFAKSAWSDEDWERSIWNDEDFAAYLESNGIEVVYLSGKENPAFYSTLEITSLPTVLFYRGTRLRSSRSGLYSASDEVRQKYIEWIEQVRSGKTPVESAYEAVDADPDDVGLRGQLMAELWKERRETEYLRQNTWLLDHHESYMQHLLAEDAELTEDYFRWVLLYQIGNLRDNLGLFKRIRDGRVSDGWADAISRLEYAEQHPWRSAQSNIEQLYQKHRLLIDLRQIFEARIAGDSATDRDRFILHALTAEGEQWQALIEQYSDDSP